MLDNRLVEQVKHPDTGTVLVEYDPATLRPVSSVKNKALQSAPRVNRARTDAAVPAVIEVEDPESAYTPDYAISWLNMPADNRDKPRECQPTLADCQYRYDLILHKLGSP